MEFVHVQAFCISNCTDDQAAGHMRTQRVHMLATQSPRQYGFIKTWTTQDFLAWTYEYLPLCDKSKNGLIIPKLNFKKAFHKVEHHVILDILKHKGVSEPSNLNWLLWQP
jgi:hypothetical protein